MGYFAKNDRLFEDGFFVEDHDLRNLSALPSSLMQIIEAEAIAGNKICHTQHSHELSQVSIQLSGAALCDWSHLPEGVARFTKYTDLQFPVYDGSLYVMYHLASGHGVIFLDPDADEISDAL